MKVRRKPSKRARIEIIPMIDVIFFLLVFFMTASLSMSKLNTVPVALPKTSSSPQSVKQKVILAVKKNGDIFINENPVDLEQVGVVLAALLKNTPQEVVLVNADEGASYGRVIQAMDKARQLGIRKFALATEPEGHL